MRDDFINEWIIDGYESINRVVDNLPEWHVFIGLLYCPKLLQRYEAGHVFSNFI